METQDTTSSVYRILMKLFPSASPPLPSVEVTSFFFAGTIGGTLANPRAVITFTNTTSITYILYQSAGSTDSSFSSIGTTTVSSPASPLTLNIPAPGNTIANRWYYYRITATGDGGETIQNTVHLQNLPPPLPTATITSFSFLNIGTTSAQPSVVVANTDATSLSWTLYYGTGTSDSGYSVYSTGTQTPTGSNTITSPLATDVDRWYYYSVTVTNVSGSDTVTTTHLQNGAAPPDPPSRPTILSAGLDSYGSYYFWYFAWEAGPTGGTPDTYVFSIYNTSTSVTIDGNTVTALTTYVEGTSVDIYEYNDIRFSVYATNTGGNSATAQITVQALPPT